MAARLRTKHQDEIRTKIQTSALIHRVQEYALGNLSDEDVSSNRLNAIKLLLSKTLPDMSAVQIDANVEGELKVEIIRFGEKK